MTDILLAKRHGDLSIQLEEQLLPNIPSSIDIHVPPGEELTFEGLRVRAPQEILLQITSVLKQQASSQTRFINDIHSENKLRPTFIELSKMFASSLTSVNASEYVHVEVVDRIAQRFTGQFHSSLISSQQEVSNMRSDLSRVNDKFLEGFRKLDQMMNTCTTLTKRSLDHNKVLASRMFRQWRLHKLFNAWKETAAALKFRKLMVKRILSRLIQKQQRKKLARWRRAVSLTQVESARLRSIEGQVAKSLNIGKVCVERLNEMQNK